MYKVMTIIKIWKYSVFSEKLINSWYLALFMDIKGIIQKGIYLLMCTCTPETHV